MLMSKLEQGRYFFELLSHVQLFATLWTVAARLLCPWNSPGKNTEVGCHSLLQDIFPTQGLNLGLVHCRLIHYHLSHQEAFESYIHIFFHN